MTGIIIGAAGAIFVLGLLSYFLVRAAMRGNNIP